MDRRMKLIGFDMDGTITEEWFTKYNWTSEDQKQCKFSDTKVEQLTVILKQIKPFLIPLNSVHIITARPFQLFDITYSWLVKNEIPFLDIHTPFCTFEEDSELISNAKADIINYLGLDYYFEDDLKIRERLITLSPDTKILEPEEAIQLGFAKRNFYD